MSSLETHEEYVVERFGYRQELLRTLGYFSNFAITFSVVSITTGLFANYGNGLREAGPAFIWTWPMVGAGQLLVALVFARLARQIPLSGYAYHWTRQLAGPRLAWWAGWLMILQFLTGMPGVCYALATYLTPYLGLAPTSAHLVLMTAVGLVGIALINHFGIRMASLWNQFTVLAEVGGLSIAGIILFALATVRRTHGWTFLVSHPGHPSGVPYLGAFAFSSLMSAWTITGFECAANMAEETHQPVQRVPRIIVFSQLFAVGMGFVILLGFTLSIPSVSAVENHPTPLLYILASGLSPVAANLVMALVFVAMFGSALANVTTLSRMVWSMARDGQLPASQWLSRVSSRKVPANATWAVTALAIFFVIWARFEVVITGIASLAAYLTYAVVVAATLLGRREGQWLRIGKNTPRLDPQSRSSGSGLRSPETQLEGATEPQSNAERPKLRINVAAFIWLVILLGMLSLPRSARTNSLAMLVALGVGALWYGLAKPARARVRAEGPNSQ